MGRAPCCSKVGLHRGPWTAKEDALLINYIEAHGEGQWRSMPKKAGLLRCGKSCRLRWMNYLRPDIKRGNITPDEDDLIVRLHGLLGNKWSLIAGRLPGRTDNEIKNYWNTHLSKKLRSQGTDPNTHKKLSEIELEKLAKNNYNKKRCRTSSIFNNKHTNHKSTKSQKLDDEEGERTKIHLPKPVRVKPVHSLTRNNSNGSLETNNNSVGCTSGSSSQNQTLNLNYGLTPYDSENNVVMPWIAHHASMETNVHDDHLMITMGSSCGYNHDVNIDVMQPHDDGVGATCNNNQQLEKLYEEYLQLIKADHHHHHHGDGDGDGDDVDGEVELDSFTQSFLI